MSEPSANKVLLVGWDAADWKVIHPLMDAGRMPALQSLLENGVSGNISTLHPVLSPTLWTSIATGKRPFDHGVLGFSEPTPDGKGVQPITNLSRKTKAIWNILNQSQLRSLVVGWWPSHPVEPINGVMVSNHYHRAMGPLADGWPMAPGTVHPLELREQLAALRFHPDEQIASQILPFVPRAAEIDQAKDRRLASCLKILCECTSIHACATELIENEPWDLAAVYYDAIDHFSHGFMKYHPPRQSKIREEDFELYKHVVSTAYMYHDMMLARLLELVDSDTTVIVISDHGFHPDHLRPESIPREPAGPAIEHRDFGIFVMKGPGIKCDELIHGVSLLDITPTLLTLFGLPVGEDMEGKSLTSVFEQAPQVRRIPSWDDLPGDDGRHAVGQELNPFESKAALDQLVALGYIEPPGEDQELAVENTLRELNYNLAQAHMDADRNGDAEPLLEDLYARYPLEFRFAVKLAICYRALDRTDKLAPLVEQLRTRRRSQAEAARGRLREFAEVARKRRDLRGERGTEKDLLADANNESGEPRVSLFNDQERESIRELRALAKVNLAAIDFLAGYIHVADGNPDQALEHLLEAEKADVPRPGLHLQIGEAYLKLHRWKDAERSFRKAGEIDSVNANVHMGLCRCYLNRRQNRRAATAALKTVGLRYHYPMAHFCLGVALKRLGKIDRAVQALEVAATQNPNFAEVHEQLASIYETSLADAERAAEHQELAAEIRAANDERQRAQRRRTAPPRNHVEIDFQQTLPKAPEVELPEPQPQPQRTTAASLTPRIGQAAVPALAPSRIAADGQFVTVVTGLPRSGTSMMMQMLEAGGLETLSDGHRQADAAERVKSVFQRQWNQPNSC
jgi:arylsulfatase A-like enzyme/Flp pilus assembly protein TadD